jgi:hypothetical protein
MTTRWRTHTACGRLTICRSGRIGVPSWAVHQVNPEVLRTLNEVLPLMQEHVQREQEFQTDGWEPIQPPGTITEIEIPSELVSQPPPESLGTWQVLVTFIDQFLPESDALVDAIRAWAVQFNLTDEWILDIAVTTLGAWVNEPEAIDQPTWHFPDILMLQPLNPTEKQFSFAASWDAPFESWQDFDPRIQRSFRKARDEFKEQVEGLLQSRGWQHPSTRQTEHFRWLALYQVKTMSALQIFTKLKLNLAGGANTVSKGITKTAGLIGLTLRQPKYGPAKRR